MSKTVDTRVVEMRFDNKQFEKEASASLTTLQKLKKALDFSDSEKTLKQLNKTAKSSSFDAMLKSVQNLEKRFSTMGIVGMRVIENLTDATMKKFLTAINYIDNAIVEGGKKRAFNIENAHFQLQALLRDEAKVQAIMADANASVTDTAYGYDEAAKAASQFAATGLQAGEEMQRALKGIAGVAAMTNSEYEGISQIFTTVAGQGRLMGDQLLQLATRGLNAAATLADFFNGVNSGAIEATENVRLTIQELTGGLQVTEGDIRDFVSKGQVSFNVFAEAMGETFGDSAKRANETFNGALSNMRAALGRIGAEFYAPLIAQNSEVVLLINSVKDRINEVKKALTFDKEIGNTNALAKQFTDTVLKIAKVVREDFVEKVDLQGPIRIFYHLVESVKNSAKGLFEILKPMGVALKVVFVDSLKMSTLEDLSAKLEKFTARLKMSTETSNKLRQAFQGVFNVVKLLGTIFVKLLGAIIPLGSPMSYLGSSLADLAGNVGVLLTKFSLWAQNSPTFNKAFEVLGQFIQGVVIGIGALVEGVLYLIKAFNDLPIVQKVLDKLRDIFDFLGKKASKNLETTTGNLKDFTAALKVVIPEKIDAAFERLGDAVNRLKKIFSGFDLTTPKKAFESLKYALLGLVDVFAKSDGINSFVENLKAYMQGLREAFTIDRLLDNIEKFRSIVGGFVVWLRDIFAPIVKELNLGTFVAGGTGVGIVYAMIKMSGAFESIAKAIGSFSKIPDFFGAMKGVMASYQKDLNASALIKVAGAIAILCGSLILMSFANPDNLMTAAVALSMVAGVLLLGINKFMEVTNRGGDLNDAINRLAHGLTKSLNNLAKAVKWKAIAKAFKNFGIAIGVITASIIALALMYKKDAASVDAAVDLMKKLAIGLVAVIGVVSLIGQILPKGMKAMKSASDGLLELSLSIGIIVLALDKIFKMTIPADAEEKLWILGGLLGAVTLVGVILSDSKGSKLNASPILALTAMLYVAVQSLDKIFKMNIPGDFKEKLAILAAVFGGLALIGIVVGKSSKSINGKSGGATSILALTAMLYVTVQSLEKIMKMELPYDYEERLWILGGIFGALALLMYAIGNASKSAQGKLKAAGTILAMCAFIGTVTGALMVLQLIPGDKLLKGAVALGAVLLALGGALAGAGKIAEPNAYKSVLAMAVMVGSITAALAILSLIPLKTLAKSATVLGVMLLAIAVDFAAIGKITNKNAWTTVLAMAGVVVVIAGSLSILSDKPWESLLAAGASLGGVLLAIAGCFKIISDSKPDLTKSALFLLASGSMILVVASLVALSSHPWQSLLAAGTALSETLLAFSAGFLIISKSNPDLMAIASFVAASASVLLVAAAIAMLAEYPWTGLLAAGTALSKVLLSMSVAMAVCTIVGNFAGPAIAGIALLDLFIADLALVLVALGAIFKGEAAQALLNGGIDTLVKIGDGIARFVDAIIGGTLEKLSERLPRIGENISQFMISMDPFFEGARRIDEKAMKGVASLAETLLIITAADLINGIVSFFKGGKSTLSAFGQELAKFGPYLALFAASVMGIDAAKVEAAALSAEMMSKVVKNLPRSGAITEKIFGTKNTLAEFGQELAKFGPYLALFATSVENVSPEKVEAAARAAEMMSKVAKNLPNEGGWVGTIFGENPISAFGEELEAFGPHIARFAEDVKDIQPEMVEGAANATSILAKVAKNLPNEGGWVAKLFGDNTMTQFGDGLKALGSALKNFYEETVGIDNGALEAAAAQLQNIVDICKGLSDFDTSGMTGFSAALESMGQTGINAFVQGFVDSMNRVEEATNTMLGYVISALDTGKLRVVGSGGSIGIGLANAIQTGVTSRQSATITTIQTLMNAIVAKTQTLLNPPIFVAIGTLAMNGLNQSMIAKQGILSTTAANNANRIILQFSSKLTASKLSQIAVSAMGGLINGIQSKSFAAANSATNVANSAINAFSRNFTYWRLYSIGANAALGLADGIRSKIYEIANAAIEAAAASVDAARETLDVRSPSRVFAWIGRMLDEGLANGILANMALVSIASQTMANSAVEETEDSLSGISRVVGDILGDGLNPIITPSMDLSGIREDCDILTRMMNSAIGETFTKTASLTGSVVGEDARKRLDNENFMNGLSGLFKDSNQPSGNVWNNVWNIQGEDPESIAQEVSEILQKQVERKEAVWGM